MENNKESNPFTFGLSENAITKLKHELSDLYEIKINIKEGNNKKMLFEIWEHFNPEDKEIEEIDEKWCK